MSDLGANDMRMLINFEIQRIYAGWFDVLFKTNKEEVVVTASDAWGNDSPKLFLQGVRRRIKANGYEKWNRSENGPEGIRCLSLSV